MKAQAEHFAHILAEAKDASADAAFSYLLNYGDRADMGGACIVIPNARGAFGRWLKAQGVAEPHHAGGYAVTILGKLSANSRIIYEKGCDAFVRVLEAYGIEAHTHSYAD